MTNLRHALRAATILLTLATLHPRTLAHWARPTDAPVDRLVENFEQFTLEHPDDPEGYYRLGRVHSLAFTLKKNTVRAFTDRDGNWHDVAPNWMQRWALDNDDAPASTEEQRTQHLRHGVIALNRAIARDRSDARFFLSLASLLEEGVDQAGKLDVAPFISGIELDENPNAWPPLDRINEKRVYDSVLDVIRQTRRRSPSTRDRLVKRLLAAQDLAEDDLREKFEALLREDSVEQAKESYFISFTLALPVDSKRSEQPIRGVDSLIVHEGGTAYLRMLRSPFSLARSDEKLRQKITKRVVDAFENLPMSGAITPIIFPVNADVPLEQLIDDQARVNFNLDGTNRIQSWPWVTPDAALLVWDPLNTGKITSGKQLFGSVTWWMFFDNGYLALDALDDNRDGQLTGLELSGIRVWIDHNINAVSDPGEVMDLDQFNIAAISTAAPHAVDNCPANNRGITRKDGTTIPTIDWIATPHTTKEPTP